MFAAHAVLPVPEHVTSLIKWTLVGELLWIKHPRLPVFRETFDLLWQHQL